MCPKPLGSVHAQGWHCTPCHVSGRYQIALLSERGIKFSLSILSLLRLVHRNRSARTGSRFKQLYPRHEPFPVEPSQPVHFPFQLQTPSVPSAPSCRPALPRVPFLPWSPGAAGGPCPARGSLPSPGVPAQAGGPCPLQRSLPAPDPAAPCPGGRSPPAGGGTAQGSRPELRGRGFEARGSSPALGV